MITHVLQDALVAFTFGVHAYAAISPSTTLQCLATSCNCCFFSRGHPLSLLPHLATRISFFRGANPCHCCRTVSPSLSSRLIVVILRICPYGVSELLGLEIGTFMTLTRVMFTSAVISCLRNCSSVSSLASASSLQELSLRL